MQPSHAAAAVTDDSEELARFRAEWQDEVRRRRQEDQKEHTTTRQLVPESPSAATTSAVAQSEATTKPDTLPPPDLPPETLHVTPAIYKERRKDKAKFLDEPAPLPLKGSHAPDGSSAPLGKVLSRAVQVYRRAVLCEQQSNLDEALRLYREAFRMDPNVDRAYHRVEAELQRAAAAGEGHARRGSVSGRKAVDEITPKVRALDIHSVIVPEDQVKNAIPPNTLAGMLASWPAELKFDPEDEREPVHIERLPDELLVHVLRRLDTTSIERFAAVSRKARAVTLDMLIWRDFVEAIYKPPQIPEIEELDNLVHRYTLDFRRLYIEHPRVRLDGVYIAVCHYIRAGLSENAWVNVSHLITYHRYLRFYPNGQVLSLLANEEMPPQQIIPMLKPTLRMKGLYIGEWLLAGTEVRITSLLDLSPPPGTNQRYTFQMKLGLRSRPLGRWNVLDFRAYDSVHLDTGEVTPLALKHERPFWFSKVRSYG